MMSRPATPPRQPPRVSVLIPCHDLGAYLEEAIDSTETAAHIIEGVAIKNT